MQEQFNYLRDKFNKDDRKGKETTDGAIYAMINNLDKIQTAVEDYVIAFNLQPVKTIGKKPVVKWSDAHYKSDDNTGDKFRAGENVAIRTGKASGITVLDIDNKTFKGVNTVQLFRRLMTFYMNYGYEQEETKRFYENCPYSKTGGGGLHFVMPYMKDIKSGDSVPSYTNGTDTFKLSMDVKNDKSLCTFPPSIHRTSNKYEWVRDLYNHDLITPPNWVKSLMDGATVAEIQGWIYMYNIPNLEDDGKGVNLDSDDFDFSKTKKKDMPTTVDELRDIVMRINPDMADNMGQWKTVLWAIRWTAMCCEYHKHPTITAQVGLEIADEFSKQSDKYCDIDEVQRTMTEDKQGRIKFGSLVFWSKNGGVSNIKKNDIKNDLFLDVGALYKNQTADEKKIQFQHFGQFRDLVQMSKQGLSLLSVIKYLRATTMVVTNGGNQSVFTKCEKSQRMKNNDIKTYFYNVTNMKGYLETLDAKCPVLNTPGEEEKYYNPKKYLLSTAIKKLAMEDGVLPSCDIPEFVPYLHEDPTDKYTFNLFTGYPLYEVVKNSDHIDDFKESKFYEHTVSHTCDSNKPAFEYLLNWIAHLIQKPDERPGVNILLYGRQGTGKGTLAEFIKSLIGDSYYGMYNSIKDFTNRFNSDQQGKLLILLDELSDSVKGGNEVHNQIKNKTTDNTLRIEPKGRQAYYIANRARYIAASNSAYNLRIEQDDRRFFCLEVSPKDKNNISYYTPLYREINDIEFRKSAFKFFMDRDISNFHPEIIPFTKLKQEQKLQSQPIVQFIQDIFNREHDVVEPAKSLFVDDAERKIYTQINIGATDLYKIYSEWCRECNEKPRAKKYFYNDLELTGIPKRKNVCWMDADLKAVTVVGFKLARDDVENLFKKYLHNTDFTL